SASNRPELDGSMLALVAATALIVVPRSLPAPAPLASGTVRHRRRRRVRPRPRRCAGMVPRPIVLERISQTSASRSTTRTSTAGDEAALRREIIAAAERLGLPPTSRVRSCYEAGRDGFWVHRLLERLDVINVVVDSASIEVSRRHRRAKTDRLDAEALLRRLIRYWLGERDQWKIVHVPSVEAEDARHLERTLAMLTGERTRCRNRLHGLLATHGVRVRVTRGVEAD